MLVCKNINQENVGMKEFQIKAYAKINLSIDVLGKRADNYHEVRMILQQIELFDEIKISYYAEGNKSLIDVASDTESVPKGEGNIVFKAARLMQELFPENAQGDIYIHIKKNIPMAAGLGGGSADAAAVLHGLNVLWQKEMTLPQLMEAGVKIGADVPFLIMAQAASHDFLGYKGNGISTCAVAQGIGEKLKPTQPLKAFILLSKPDVNVSTKEIYEGLNLGNIYIRPDTKSIIEGLANEDLGEISLGMYNLLQEVSEKKYPIISDEINKMANLVPQGQKIMMSGSGPTVFTLFSDEDQAIKAYNLLKGQSAHVYLSKTSY